MTHLPYIMAAYGITTITLTSLWIVTRIRLNENKKKLDSLNKQYHET